MSTLMTEEQSSEVDDFLAHYGVKGMRWGHRKAPEQSSGGGSSAKAKKAPEKKKSIASRVGGSISKAVDASANRDAQIEKARVHVETEKNRIAGEKRRMKSETKMFSKERKRGRQDIRNMKLDLLTHPDSATAMRMTSGEMFTAALFGPPGEISARSRAADSVARKAATGYYQSKKK